MENIPKIVDKKLLLDGYIYLKSKTHKGKTYWDCKRVRQRECTARAITMQVREEVVVLKGPRLSPHQHPPNREEAEAENVIRRLKRAAEEHPEQPPARILRNELRNVPSGVLAQLPERENLKKTMRRERRRYLPPNPKSLEDLEGIPDRFKRTLMGDNFMIYDSREVLEEEEGGSRVIVFATRRNIELLAKSEIWFLDGTFKVCPEIFTQIFTVMGLVKRAGQDPEDADEAVALPLVFALLSSKEQIMYGAVLRAVASAAHDFRIDGCSPQKIMTDFEKAIINASITVFPGVQVSCCMFHLGQTLYRKIQTEGLQESYNNHEDRQLKLQTHMLLALAFVPPPDVNQCFNDLRNEVQDELLGLMDYFDEYYIRGRAARGRRRAIPPRYAVETWNQYNATLYGQHRTNNINEGWHNRFRLIVGKNHPDLYSALKEFQKEQADTEGCLAEFSLGRTVKAMPKKKWNTVQKRLRTITLQYERYRDEGRTMDYLRSIAHNVTITSSD